MIYFRELYGEGYGSLIDIFKIKLDYSGITTITGEVGSGKTTIYSLLYWVIYGTPLKEKASIQTWPHKRPSTFRGTFGKVVFSAGNDNFEIIRCLSFKGDIPGIGEGGDKLILKKNGEWVNITGKKNIQSEISNIIGYSPRLFKSAVIFGQKLKRFSEEDGPTKNAIIEEIFEMDYITKAKDKAEVMLSDYVTKFNRCETVQNELGLKLQHYQRELEHAEVYLNEFDSKKEAKHQELTKKLKETKKLLLELKQSSHTDAPNIEQVEVIRQNLIKSRKLVNNYDYINNGIKKLLEKERDLKKEERDISISIKHVKCTLCNQSLPDESMGDLRLNLAEVERELKRISGKISSEQATLPDIKDISIPKLEKAFLKAQSEYNEAKSVLVNIRNKEELIDGYRKSIEENKNSTLDLDITKFRTRIAGSKKKIKLQKNLSNLIKSKMEDSAWLSNIALSNKGLKSYIFSKLLYTLNDELRALSKSIGFTPQLYINEESARKEIILSVFDNKSEVGFHDLSGGQSQLVNVIIALACSNLLNMGNRKTNILMLDEISEGLSTKALSTVSDYVLPLIKDRSLYIVTHRLELNIQNSRNLSVTRSDAGSKVV